MTTNVKICGITTEAALDATLDAGADYVGFVFFPKSPRNVSLNDAKPLFRRARKSGNAKIVALVVDASDALLDDIACDLAPDILQLHGHESVERVAEIAANTDLAIWKAVPVATIADVAAAAQYARPGRADMVLFDAKPPADLRALPGGNGLAFDWRILDAVKNRQFVLAGGLTPENVADAIRLVKPAVVDVSSGVETSPGVKSPELIRGFIRAANEAKV